MGDRQTAISFYNQAVTAVKDDLNKDRLKHAYQLFMSACMADPTWGEAFYQAGNNNSDLGLQPSAIGCWYRAVENAGDIDPSLKAKAMINLSYRLHGLGRVEEAYKYVKQALELDANQAYGWTNLSCINQTRSDPEEMLSAAKMACALDPEDRVNLMQRAFALLYAQQWVEGFKEFEIRFEYKLRSYLQFPYPKWAGEPDKTVYLVADQGLGDTLSFARFVPELCKRVKFVHAAVQPELLRLFNNVFVNIPNLNIIPQPNPFPQADAWSTFVSLPWALSLTEDEIVNAPQMKPPPSFIPKNWKVPDRKIHIGIAWYGSPANDINVHRSIPLDQFADLYRVPGVQLYSLQVGNNSHEMNDRGFAPLMRDTTRYITDVVDTLALLQHLDLVITCESALGHICAMAGKECWIPYSLLGRDYRIGLTGEKMIWTPHHRVFRQQKAGDWQPVFDEIVETLRERVHGI